MKTIKWANFKFSNIHGPRFPTRPISIILDRPQNLTPSHAWIGLQLKPKTKLKTGSSQNQTQIGPSLSPSPTRLHLLPSFPPLSRLAAAPSPPSRGGSGDGARSHVFSKLGGQLLGLGRISPFQAKTTALPQAMAVVALSRAMAAAA